MFEQVSFVINIPNQWNQGVCGHSSSSFLQEIKAFKSIPNSILICGEDLCYTLKQQNYVTLVISYNVAVIVAFTVTFL